jgi:D-alanyl-D-alanine endopeptidase (penicillin-binding protein 7)
MAFGLAWIGRMRRAQPTDAAWQARLSLLAQRFGLARKVSLRVVDGLASPITAGWWRPIVLVPASLLTGMAPDLLEALLAHELAHVRRHDYLVTLVQSGIESLLFYHPAVWWLSRRIRAERELVADALAAQCLGEPRRLARALSELERVQFGANHLALAAADGDLAARVRRLVRPESQALQWKAALPILALAVACFANAHVAQPEPNRAVVARNTAALVDFKTCDKPNYPHAELVAGHQGKSTLSFLIDMNGEIQDTKVEHSSGYPELDEAARSALAKCRFHPATVDGKPVLHWQPVQYVWTLE